MSKLTLKVSEALFAPAAFESFEGTWELPVLEAGPDEYCFSEPLSWKLTLTNTGGALLADGSVVGHARTNCARCMEEFELDLSGEIEGFFIIPGHESDERQADAEEEEFELLSEDGVIDLEPLLTAALLMELPLVPLHAEDCLGLCTYCGKNLNEGPCDCTADPEVEAAFEQKRNPFAVLKDYDFGGGSSQN